MTDTIKGEQEMSTEPYDPAAAALIAASPMPTAETLRQRRNVFVQFGRFIAFNLRILKVVGMQK